MTVPAPLPFPRPYPTFAVAVFGCALLVPSHARAQTTPFPEGIALSPIQPAPAGDRFFLAPDAATDTALPDAFPLRAMAFSHLTLSPSLRRTTATGTEDIIEHQLYVHANLAYAPVNWLLLHADLPFAVVQQGQGPLAPSSATGDLRLGARFGVFGDRKSAFSFAPGVDVWTPTGSERDVTSDGEVRVEPKLLVSGKAGVFVYAANVGFLFRKHYNPGTTEVGDSLTYGAAAGLSLFDDMLQVGPELQALMLADSDSTPSLAFQGRTSPITGMLGARVQLGDFNIGAGFGVPLTEAPGNASRVFLSLTFLPVGHVEAKASASATATATAEGETNFDDEPPEPEPEPEPAAPPEPAPAPAAAAVVVPAATTPAQPAKPTKPPPPPVDPSKGPPVATFVGFRELSPGTVLVFVELTREVNVELTKKGRVLEYHLAGTQVTLRNNRNPLLADHFHSVLESAQLVPDGKSVKLVVKLRGEAEAVARVEKHAQGATLRIELTGTPDAPKAAAKPAPAPAP